MSKYLRVTRDSVMWGRHRENGVWLAFTPRRRLMLPWLPPGHDAVFIALGRLRVRIMTRHLDYRQCERNRQDEQTVLGG
jgi:hypothetical protein